MKMQFPCSEIIMDFKWWQQSTSTRAGPFWEWALGDCTSHMSVEACWHLGMVQFTDGLFKLEGLPRAVNVDQRLGGLVAQLKEWKLKDLTQGQSTVLIPMSFLGYSIYSSYRCTCTYHILTLSTCSTFQIWEVFSAITLLIYTLIRQTVRAGMTLGHSSFSSLPFCPMMSHSSVPHCMGHSRNSISSMGGRQGFPSLLRPFLHWWNSQKRKLQSPRLQNNTSQDRTAATISSCSQDPGRVEQTGEIDTGSLAGLGAEGEGGGIQGDWSHTGFQMPIFMHQRMTYWENKINVLLFCWTPQIHI